MTQQSSRQAHPVLWGFVAMLAVSLVVGVIFGAGALVASRAVGLTGGGGGGEGSGAQDTLSIPALDVEDTQTATEPPPASETPSETEEATAITLAALQTAVAPMANIDLSGTYPGGDGAVLQVQRFSGGQWEDFPVTILVSGETFSTYIQTGQTGLNRLRVVDTDLNEESNEVEVQVG